MTEYTVKKFMYNGNAYNLAISCKVWYLDFLMVWGGGSGSSGTWTSNYYCSGWGWGGVMECFCQAIFDNTYPVKIWIWGCAAQPWGNTEFYWLIAYGGGKWTCSTWQSGGSGSWGGTIGNCAWGLGCVWQGHNWGRSCNYGAGGWGWGWAAGCTAPWTCYWGAWGAGYLSCISWEACYYAWGGWGAGCKWGGTWGIWGWGNWGGGAANYYWGWGGGSNKNSTNGGAWYQGIVIVRYPADGSYGFNRATWWNCCYLCNWNCVHIFTGDGIFTPVF